MLDIGNQRLLIPATIELNKYLIAGFFVQRQVSDQHRPGRDQDVCLQPPEPEAAFEAPLQRDHLQEAGRLQGDQDPDPRVQRRNVLRASVYQW